jgi:hypothetical protein
MGDALILEKETVFRNSRQRRRGSLDLRFHSWTYSTPLMSQENTPLNDRARRAAKIVAKPDEYKVCEGCESIVKRRAATCPNCHGYRFNEDAAAVIAQAQLLAGREQTSVIAEDLE